MNQRGITILEVAMATAVLALLLGSVAAAVAGDSQAHRTLAGQVGPEMAVRSALERMVSELRMAGEWGEDRDRDGLLDDGEDVNGNGVLDADWNLAEGAEDQTQIVFNRRIDQIVDGEVRTSGVYSRRISYSVESGALLRVAERTDASGTVHTNRTILVRGVRSLRFSRQGTVVVVGVEIDVPRGNTIVPRLLTARIWLRN